MAKKITKEQLNATANDNGYDAILCDDTISEAVLFLNGQANKNNLDDLSQLIVDGANGKQVREEMLVTSNSQLTTLRSIVLKSTTTLQPTAESIRCLLTEWTRMTHCVLEC